MKVPQDRIDRSVRYMKRMLASGDGAHFDQLDEDARFLYLVSILVCNDVGLVSTERLNEAMKDEDVRYAAVLVAGRLGWLGALGTTDRYA